MKKYKHILEAINRGIQLALDDIENIEDNNSISGDIINTNDVIQERVELAKIAVDLGLPSGTLWCKYNLGVDLNQLSKAENWHGDYYAWGELEANKPAFNWDNYKFGKIYNNLTKYCNRLEYGLNGFNDNLTELLPEDDAAYQTKKLYNYKFHIPTKEQCEELKKYTKNYWVKNYDPNKTIHNLNDGGIKGLNGRIFEGKNGNQLFIPAAGYRDDSYIYYVGFYCYLWSSSFYLDSPSDAYGLYFNSVNIDMDINGRYSGYNVRPVINL